MSTKSGPLSSKRFVINSIYLMDCLKHSPEYILLILIYFYTLAPYDILQILSASTNLSSLNSVAVCLVSGPDIFLLKR